MARGRWLTPETLPETSIPVVINCPDSREFRGYLLGALFLLSQPENWERFGDIEPEEVAYVWSEVLSSVVDGLGT